MATSLEASSLVPRPHPQGGRGSGLHRVISWAAECCMSCDWHDNASFWHGNASVALTRMPYAAIVRCHMIVSDIPHVWEFRNETSSSPRKRSIYTRPSPSLRVRSGNETIKLASYGDHEWTVLHALYWLMIKPNLECDWFKTWWHHRFILRYHIRLSSRCGLWDRNQLYPGYARTISGYCTRTGT